MFRVWFSGVFLVFQARVSFIHNTDVKLRFCVYMNSCFFSSYCIDHSFLFSFLSFFTFICSLVFVQFS